MGIVISQIVLQTAFRGYFIFMWLISNLPQKMVQLNKQFTFLFLITLREITRVEVINILFNCNLKKKHLFVTTNGEKSVVKIIIFIKGL